MKRAIGGLLFAVMILSYGSCSRDHLYYETNRCALIQIEIDWEARTHLDPNGVSAYVYDSNGDRFSNVILSSDPNNVYLKLPLGDYSVVFHNNSISELSGVHLTGSGKLDDFSIHANEASYEPIFDKLDNELFVNEPDEVASYTLRNLHVGKDDIQYHYYKPDLAYNKQEVSQKIHIEPDHIVHVTRIMAYMDGAEFSSTKKPKAVLHGMSGGYYFGAECTSDENVMEEFDVNIVSRGVEDDYTHDGDATRTGGALDILDPDDEDGYTDEELEGLGHATVDISTFGMHTTDPEDQKYYLYIRFFLYDGTYVDYEVDVTGYIGTEDLGTNNLHTIELILEPLPDGGGNPGDGSWGPGSEGEDGDSSGVFDPSLDDWVDVEVELPM